MTLLRRRAHALHSTPRLATALVVLLPALTEAQPAAVDEGAAFTRITSGELVTLPALYWGGSWGDYDGDGWLDFFVGASVASTRNFLFHNERDGTFSPARAPGSMT